MKVTGTSVNKVINIYEINKKQAEKSREVTKKDTLEISKLGKSLSAYAEDITSMPAERLDQIRNEISSGTYNVDARLIAQKMIEEMKISSR